MKKLTKFIINSILGVLLLFLINEIGATWNFHIGINIFTSLFVRNFWNTRCNIVGNIKDYYIKGKLEVVGIK